MSEQIRVLGQALKALCAIQDATWTRNRRTWGDSSNIDDDTYNTCMELINNWTPLKEKDTESYFPKDSKSVKFNLSDDRKALYLSPTSKQPRLIPVISLDCNINDTENKIKIRIMLFQKIDTVLKSIGFRFEKGEDIHDFYHVQLSNELQGAKRSAKPVGEYLKWLPDSEPAIPVKANDPITLLLCLLISLYGLGTCYKLVTEHQISELKNYLGYFDESNGKSKSKKKK